MEIDEELEEHIVVDSSEGPTPCKMPRKQIVEECDETSTEDLEGTVFPLFFFPLQTMKYLRSYSNIREVTSSEQIP